MWPSPPNIKYAVDRAPVPSQTVTWLHDSDWCGLVHHKSTIQYWQPVLSQTVINLTARFSLVWSSPFIIKHADSQTAWFSLVLSGPSKNNLMQNFDSQYLPKQSSIQACFHRLTIFQPDVAVFCLGFFCRARRPAPFSWRPALLKKPKWRRPFD